MIVDAKCQRIYRSADLEHWDYTGSVLDNESGRSSDRTDDLGPGLQVMLSQPATRPGSSTSHTPTGTAPTYFPAIRVARPSRSRSFRSSGIGSSARATDLSMWTFRRLDRRLRELFASGAHRRWESGPELITQSVLLDVGRDHQRREPDTVDVGRPVG